MLNDRNLVVDTLAEVYALLQPWRTHEFWDFANHEPIENSVYVLGRRQMVECQNKVRFMCSDSRYVMIFCNAAEGSTPLREQCSRVLNIEDLILSGRLLVISGGDLPDHYPYVTYEHFLCCILDYAVNREQMQRRSEIFDKTQKPYDFLFLNGRGRDHRRYLLERFRMLGLLERSLYTYLDGRGSGSRLLSVFQDGQELMKNTINIKTLPPQYEVSKYRDNLGIDTDKHYFAKTDIFNHEWGEIYLQAEPYIDTYFSVVTETVFEEPWSFRTEKIAKVLAQGHPWICATSRGWYRDLRRMGFRTFDHVIDESFDLIDDHRDRMERIVSVVNDLCQQDLVSFLAQCEDVCKYNQQHLIEFSQRHRLDFPDRFLEFIKQHG
jgi:hypothetical protein